MIQILQGDCIEVMRTLPAASVNCCVTSPPYWGLRDYGVAGQIGKEATMAEWVSKIVEVFREVHRVLRDDGTLWLNLGDSYNSPNTHSGKADKVDWGIGRVLEARANIAGTTKELKPKDLCGQPWRVAFALQADGWYLRSDIIWHKPNPMPESVTDRPTKAHEYIFLLSKSERYYYDYKAIREKSTLEGLTGGAYSPPGQTPHSNARKADKQRGHSRRHAGFNDRWDAMTQKEQCSLGRNKRTVWTIATEPYEGAHFATYPGKLIEPCILAGCPEGGTVLDPFAGSDTTLEVAGRFGRHAIGIELNPGYIPLIEKRTAPWREQKSLFEADP